MKLLHVIFVYVQSSSKDNRSNRCQLDFMYFYLFSPWSSAGSHGVTYERKPPSSSNPPIERADFLDLPDAVELFLRLRPAPSDELIPEVCVLLGFDDDLDFFFRFLSSLVV